ncbi:MAG: hypothetical protein V4449_02220 [Patescibacteria group bacterium]
MKHEGVERVRNPKSRWGPALLGALSLAWATNAGAQSPDVPKRSWEYGDLSPADAKACERAAANEIKAVKEGRPLNGGNLCSSDDVPNEIYRLNLERMNRGDGANGGQQKGGGSAGGRVVAQANGGAK